MNRSKEMIQSSCFTSLSIRQEISRFESVHPAIYSLYELIHRIPDPLLASQIRDHVVIIEGESVFLRGDKVDE